MASNDPETDIANPLDIYLGDANTKMHKARSEKTAWRSAGEKYDNRPVDPEYYKKYYHRVHIIPVACPLCGAVINGTKLKRHQSFKKCKDTQEFIAKKLAELQQQEQS